MTLLHKPGEVHRLFHRRVAAADDHDVLAAEERAVAHRAGADAPALERVLALEPEPLGLRARGDDERLGGVLVVVVAGPDAEGALRQVHLVHVLGDDLGPLVRRLLAERLHQLGPGDLLGEAGVVLDVVRDHELPAGDAAADEPFEHERLEVRARGVDRGGVAGGAGADDDDVAGVRHGAWSIGPAGGAWQPLSVNGRERSARSGTSRRG